MLDEFKKFILKGNVVDLSTGVIIGAAFGNIVTAFTKGIVEPILGMFGGGPNPDLKIKLGSKTIEVAQKAADGAEVKVKQIVPFLQLDLGAVIGAMIGFLITAAVIFFVIVKPANKLMSMMKKEEAAAPPPAPPADVVLLTEIRDLLKKGA
jgi:large conductance mechanosensitive channel